jgi:hypothetical protein
LCNRRERERERGERERRERERERREREVHHTILLSNGETGHLSPL